MRILKIVSTIHFDVLGDSGNRYLVDIEKLRCTCMDWIMQTARLLPSDAQKNPSYICKHIDFVLVELGLDT